jgi:hypothetical protein
MKNQIIGKNITCGEIEFRELPSVTYDIAKPKLIYWLSVFRLKVKPEYEQFTDIILNKNLQTQLYDIFIRFTDKTFKISSALSFYFDKPEQLCEYITIEKLESKRVKPSQLDELLNPPLNREDALPIVAISKQQSRYSQIFLKVE